MATPHGYGDSENKTESEEYPSLFEALRDNGVRENESEEYTSPFESLDDNPKTFFSNDLILELDEGCVLDLTEEARGYARYPLAADRLPTPSATAFGKAVQPGDSGFSSRMSEDSASLHRGVEIPDLNKAVDIVVHHDDLIDTLDKANGGCTPKSVVRGVIKVFGVFFLLYFFICTLDLLSSAFRLLGGKTAGSVFQDSELLKNPISGLMIGVLATVILQSSSTSTSIVITMVSSGILEVRQGIPIIMGANIGTTVTNTLVSLAHSMKPNEFRRAFSGATVHDVFNWLTVLVLLPLEYFAGYLHYLTSLIVHSMNVQSLRARNQDLLKQLTKPLTQRVVTVDEHVITDIAEGKIDPSATLLKIYCTFNKTIAEVTDGNSTRNHSTKVPLEKCESLFAKLGWSDLATGIVLFLVSVVLLSICLYLMVRLLHSILGGHVARMAKKVINANFPGPFACFTDYVALLLGAGMTILVQSSSVFTSALTPLVGVGCLKLERMYPLTLGSNIGTTATGILAALASSPSTIDLALQLALCHLFFNITGILLFFPIPCMRRIPLRAAKFLGRTTARYRWFAVFYIILAFLVFPGLFLALSFAGNVVFITFLTISGTVLFSVFMINVLQKSRFHSRLPKVLQTWEWLPLCLRSLQPLDNLFRTLCSPLKKYCCATCITKCMNDSSNDIIDSDDDDSSIDEDLNTSSCCCISKPRTAEIILPEQETLMRNESNSLHPKSHQWIKSTLSPIFNPKHKSSHENGLTMSSSQVPLIKPTETSV